MADLQTQVTSGNVDPNIRFGFSNLQRYPNQFFDLGQQYMPPTIKELFRWCTFYYYNSPLIGSTIRKMSRYPITDLIFEDEEEKTRDLWDKIFNKYLKMKDRLMEINLDKYVYGNAFVSLHLPFTRFLICEQCGDRRQINQAKWSFDAARYGFKMTCSQCNHSGPAKVNDVPYKDPKAVKLIRWNPENMLIKYNEYTGRYVYMYSVPKKLQNSIMRGDKDILEDIPLIVLQAVRERKYIRFNNDNLFHFRMPTLAEQDMGWGKPLIIHVLKDLYYLYTLRRAQEAIAMEHIVPFDIIYPMPNAQQDPYVHTDLSNWRRQIEQKIQQHRQDPNFKAVIPIPVGFGRLGGDGKAMLVTPEMNMLQQQIVGGMGIPQEFLFGGLNYTGSSISLRTLENDFVQDRSQHRDFCIWVKDKLRIWMSYPDLQNIRFADFRMADDIQRNQQVIGLNAQNKLSDQTMLTELGFDFDQEVKKMIEEVFIANYLNDLRSKGMAKSQGESQLIGFNYQQKIQELTMKAQEQMQGRLGGIVGGVGQDPAGGNMAPQIDNMGGDQKKQQKGGWDSMLPAPGGDPNAKMPDIGAGTMPGARPENPQDQINRKVVGWASKLSKMDPTQAQLSIAELKTRLPDIGRLVEQEYNRLKAQPNSGGVGRSQDNPGSIEPNMNPMPVKGMPTRAGVV